MCGCALLLSERLDNFYSYSIFKNLSILGGQCSVNINIPAPKIGAFQMSPKTQNGDFLKNGSNDVDYIFWVIYGDHVLK
jgi:hypothetical protein